MVQTLSRGGLGWALADNNLPLIPSIHSQLESAEVEERLSFVDLNVIQSQSTADCFQLQQFLITAEPVPRCGPHLTSRLLFIILTEH